MNGKRIGILAVILLLAFCLFSCEAVDTGADLPDMPTFEEQTVGEDGNETAAHEHTPAEAVQERMKQPTCVESGSYVEVISCATCGEVLSQTRQRLEKTEHQFENYICKGCGMELGSEGLLFASNGNKTCAVVGLGTCTDEDVRIPSHSPQGDKVTSIGKGAFANCKDLKSVKLPATVTEIGEEAFVNCTGLQSMVIPSAVKNIGKDAFRNCQGMESVKFETTKGWNCYDGNYMEPIELNLSDAQMNAVHLSFRWNDYTWKRS